jgi:hypothetical protein
LLSFDYQKKNNELNNNNQVLLWQYNDIVSNFSPWENGEKVDYSIQNALNKSIKTIIEEIQKSYNVFQKEKNDLESRIKLWNELVSILSLNEIDIITVLEKLDLFAKWFTQELEKTDVEKVDVISRNMTFVKLWTSEEESFEVKYLWKEGNKIPVTHDINSNECHLLPVEVKKSFIIDGRKCVIDLKKSDCWLHLCYELNDNWNWEQSDLLWFIDKDDNILVWHSSDSGQLIIDTKKHKNWLINSEICWYIVSDNNWWIKKIEWKKYKCVNYKYIQDNFEKIYANFPN